ncbi:ABC transporter [Verrucomicrobiota bacterium]|nr:ABC transporter [Verrucomicrobiota bacterium]
MKTLRRALHYFRPELPLLGGVFVLMVLATGANLLKPWPLALIVDSVLGDKPLPAWLAQWLPAEDKSAQVAALALLVFGLHAVQGALNALHNFISIKIGLRGLARVRNEVFDRLQRLSLRFHQNQNAGELIHRAAWDTFAFQTLFQQGVVTLLAASLSLVLMVWVMWRLNVSLTGVALATVPLLVLSIQFFGKKMGKRSAVAQRADSQVTTLIQQGISAVALNQSFTREDAANERFRAQTALAQGARLSQHGWEVLYGLMILLAFGVGTAALVWWGAQEVLRGELTTGQLLIFLAYLAQLFEPLSQLSNVGATVASAGANAERVFEILDTPADVTEAPGARAVVGRTRGGASTGAGDRTAAGVPSTGRIEFADVQFSYTPERPVLRGISFAVAPGESLAIIGPSGVGKTTLLYLLPRFFDPAAGGIKLDGVDLRELRLKDLRQQIAFVFQEPILLPATIAENIAFGRPGATAAEIETAARRANADAFIRTLPRQYETVVGDGAARLSVGEKQRLTLARAFLKDAPILLLDEPTSALDGESEALVVASLNELMRGRTTLVVAHRLSTIQQMDKVLVIEAGRVKEIGRPADLLDSHGYYARLTQPPERRHD